MPRFGAGAPAILSHRSPKQPRGFRTIRLYVVRQLFEHRRIARNVTVSRSDDHFDALTGRIT
ncbi:hypothetical protein EAO70_24860 [Streptomyces sp. adm13(2018)]|nr:hypothetical protein DEJ43_05395 [Streptomyces venezuelae ATCC 10712]QES10480.1 hypothetical protein DEJ44_05260 [Streptomyces venezuelae]QES16187.1 hypothetical protein DEJ45_29960 [Streptomyces venezuelae]TXS14690.1 hypothetical protein EAO70_24860 [Streptomyces sp. adm13(2018)]